MSEIRVNNFKGEDGISAPSFPNGINVTGVATATSFSGTTGTFGDFVDVGSNIKLGNAGVVTATTFIGALTGNPTGTLQTAAQPNITSVGTLSSLNVSGNVSIAGTLTYEDVTNIDSVGLITARSGLVSPYADIDDFISVGSNIHLGNAGVCTATTFSGSGANLTNLPAANITGTLPAISGANLTNLTAGNLTGTLPAISGANLTNLSGSNIAAALSAQRPSMKGIILTDDGSSSPIVSIMADDGSPWGLQLGNSTSSTSVNHGLMHYVNNSGNAFSYIAGNGAYKEWSHSTNNGSTTNTVMKFNTDRSVALYHQNSSKLTTTSTGVTVTGIIEDSKGPLRRLPMNAQSGNYTLVVADAGKFIRYGGGGTLTIPYNVFSTGDMVTIMNDTGGSVTIGQGSNFSLINSADASTGNRTLAQRGMATVLFNAQNQGYISGSGLS